MSSTHVKIGNRRLPEAILNNCIFTLFDDGSVTGVRDADDSIYTFYNDEAADLRAWLAGEPVANDAAAEDAKFLRAVTEEVGKVWEAWSEYCEANEPSIDLLTWLAAKYTNERLAAMLQLIYHAS